MPRPFDRLIARLSDRLDDDLPGHEAHATMAPRYAARQEALSVRDKACRDAGVLLLLHPYEETAAVVLTVRHQDLADHAGQISFPGGRREGTEALSETARREANEEVGLPRAAARILGPLTPLYIPPSNFCVHPFVATASQRPSLVPTDDEVDDVLQVPLDHLLAPETRIIETWTLQGTEVEVPYYAVGEHAVWGATAMMLAELLDVIRDPASPTA